MVDHYMFLQVYHDRLCKYGVPSPWNLESKQRAGPSSELYNTWRYYWAAAQICGLTGEEIGRQLKVEPVKLYSVISSCLLVLLLTSFS
jgi:hypothetical protein